LVQVFGKFLRFFRSEVVPGTAFFQYLLVGEETGQTVSPPGSVGEAFDKYAVIVRAAYLPTINKSRVFLLLFFLFVFIT
jgi:hypothetical protein